MARHRRRPRPRVVHLSTSPPIPTPPAASNKIQQGLPRHWRSTRISGESCAMPSTAQTSYYWSRGMSRAGFKTYEERRALLTALSRSTSASAVISSQ